MLHEPILQLVQKLATWQTLVRTFVDIFWQVDLILHLSAKLIGWLDLALDRARLR